MHIKISLLSTVALLLTTAAANAAPTLKADVTVVNEIVTVGDMFTDAGLLAERALFRAPAPGTMGIVSLEAVRDAALKAGLTAYDQEGVARVRVARSATEIDSAALGQLITADLRARGLVPDAAEIAPRFDTPNLSFNAEAVADPVRLVSLRYVPDSHAFSARFEISGITLPVDISGSVDLMVEAPHLTATLKAGEVITAADIEMKPVPFDFATRTGIDGADQLIGKQLKRNSRAGLMLRAADVAEPLVVTRNTQVTVIFHTGAMMLTMIGQSLSDASAGQPVQVMNSVTHKMLNGVAMANGAVEITSATLVAGL